LKVINKSNGTVIGERIKVAATFWARLKGLLGCTGLRPGAGLLLFPCSSIHTCGMKMNIDVVFLDRRFRVVKVVENLKPGLTVKQKGAHYVLEMGCGMIKEKGVNIRDELIFENDPEDQDQEGKS